MPTLAIDDRRLSYEDRGSGPVALLIHGSPGNARAWARVAERLAGRYRVAALVTVVGDRSPDITHRIARLIAERVPYGSVKSVAAANHALTTTHADAVAEAISRVGE
jgi:pimeloyl-ACP methyl ester carboxylesterase